MMHPAPAKYWRTPNHGIQATPYSVRAWFSPPLPATIDPVPHSIKALSHIKKR